MKTKKDLSAKITRAPALLSQCQKYFVWHVKDEKKSSRKFKHLLKRRQHFRFRVQRPFQTNCTGATSKVDKGGRLNVKSSARYTQFDLLCRAGSKGHKKPAH